MTQRPTIHSTHAPVAGDDPRWALTSPRAAAFLLAPDRPHASHAHDGLSQPDPAVTLPPERLALLDLPDEQLAQADPPLYAEVVRLRAESTS